MNGHQIEPEDVAAALVEAYKRGDITATEAAETFLAYERRAKSLIVYQED